MPRPKALVPALRYHISGQSICEISGTTYYLGMADSPESLARYAVLIREYQANGLKVPAHITSQTLAAMVGAFSVAPAKVDQCQEPIRVKHLTEAYRAFVKQRYEGQPTEIHRLGQLCDDVLASDGERLVKEYGPKALQAQRKKWVDEKNKSRAYVNRLTNSVVRMFKWGVAEELVEPEVWQRLKSVEPLREGYTEAYETEGVKPVSIQIVRATAVHLSPVVKAMLRIHTATGMRPSELCNMRPMDIDRTGEVWVYRPPKHKNKSKGKSRAIPLIGDAREAIIDYLNRPADSYCFSPRESMAWFRSQQRANRQTPVQPSQQNRRKATRQKEPGEKYDSHSYRQAIQRAAKTAKVDSWHPYQLRHLAATQVREALGAEAAQALLGHANLSMTLHYAKVQESKAIEAAKAAPKL
jgi:integrase